MLLTPNIADAALLEYPDSVGRVIHLIDASPTPIPTSVPTPVTVNPRSIPNYTGCYAIPTGSNTPTGIAGCQVWGNGIASYYSSGLGGAMNYCTWTVRHTTGCGTVLVTSLDTGISAEIPIVDFCDCYTGTDRERIIDLQRGVLDLLGLSSSAGLYRVNVSRVS